MRFGKSCGTFGRTGFYPCDKSRYSAHPSINNKPHTVRGAVYFKNIMLLHLLLLSIKIIIAQFFLSLLPC
ncbi:hypothetical protein [Moraxella lacunata]|uniref:hypothetical protein n=1 Tax=Moraxella lacunata TaxID=477 RepID=UPI003EE26A1D